LLTATPYSYSIYAVAPFTPIGDRFNEAGVRREAYNFYYMDTWKATPHLTLAYGLRYEVNSRIHEATKRTSSMMFLDATAKTGVLSGSHCKADIHRRSAAPLQAGLGRLGTASCD
jgi:hypothetical protein